MLCLLVCLACYGGSGHSRTDLLDLLLVGAAVNSPGSPLVVKPVGDLVKSLFKTIPVPSQAPKHPIKVLAGRLYLHFPVVQVTQACPKMNPTVTLSLLARKKWCMPSSSHDGSLLPIASSQQLLPVVPHEVPLSCSKPPDPSCPPPPQNAYGDALQQS